MPVQTHALGEIPFPIALSLVSSKHLCLNTGQSMFVFVMTILVFSVSFFVQRFYTGRKNEFTSNLHNFLLCQVFLLEVLCLIPWQETWQSLFFVFCTVIEMVHRDQSVTEIHSSSVQANKS